MKKVILIIAIAMGGRFAAQAQTTFYEYYCFPTMDTLDTADFPPNGLVGTVTVGGAPVTSVTANYSSSASATQLIFTIDNFGGLFYSSFVFNGPALFEADPNYTISTASLDAATTMSGFNAGDVSLVNGGVYVNWEGLPCYSGQQVVVDYAVSAVPEPGLGALAAFGGASLLLIRKRK
jgi:hypothetical protein